MAVHKKIQAHKIIVGNEVYHREFPMIHHFQLGIPPPSVLVSHLHKLHACNYKLHACNYKLHACNFKLQACNYMLHAHKCVRK